MECKIVIIGAGITGLTIANELIQRGFDNIIIIEKEKDIGFHASGRNSGVLHSGIYYNPDLLKARFCVEGNKLLTEYCEKNDLGLHRSGKVIVASDEDKLESLELLSNRAEKNGVEFAILNENKLKRIEPYAKTYKKAIYTPKTSIFEPKKILKSLQSNLEESGKVRIFFNTSYISRESNSSINTDKGQIAYKKLINASGSYADKIAHSFGLARQFKILPFLGTYKKLKPNLNYVNGNIYPVPDLRTPFLGVHFTKSFVDNSIYIGPTAIPALGRESYSFFEGISLETFSIFYRNLILLVRSQAFRDNAQMEIKKYISSYIFKEAKKLVPTIKIEDIVSSNKVGIRPQLVDWNKKEMVLDFLVAEDADSVHILNAISPAFTSSMSFARYIADKYF